MNPNNTPSYLTARMAMARILRDMGLHNTEEVSNETCWLDWIREALDTFNVSSLYVRKMSTRIPIQNCVAPKPCDMVMQIDLWVETPNDRRVKPDFNLGALPTPQTSYTNEEQFTNPPLNSAWGGRVGVTENGPVYQFTPNANGSHLILDYRAYSTSPDGQPTFPLFWLPPVREYCRKMYMEQSISAGFQRYSMGQLEAVRVNLDRLLLRARWEDANNRITDDLMDRLAAMMRDPMYVDQNPYMNLERQLNINHAFRGTDSPNAWRG